MPKAALRPLNSMDVDLLFEWVNRPDSLVAKALTKGPIDRATHDSWFARRLADAETRIRVIEVDGNPIGQVRLQRDPDGIFAIDVYLDAAHRGSGFAAWAIEQAIRELAQDAPGTWIRALVRVENQSSARLFQRTGFIETGRNETFITFERKARP